MEVLNEFPADILLSDFVDRIIIIAKIEKALQQIGDGNYLTEDELDREIDNWN